MNFYKDLLHSYNLLKKRKLRINEGKYSQEAEAKAKHYIQLAISHATTDHYIVSIPEIGSNAKIYVAKAGKQMGNVVVDNVLSMYPMAVANGAGAPIKGPAYTQFVGKFAQIEDLDSMPKPDMGNSLGLVGPPPSTEGLYKASSKLTSLADSKKLFSLPRSIGSPDWMTPGPMRDFPLLQQKIIGPHPFSLESKVMNASKIIQEPLFNSDISVPISDADKKVVCDSFNEFVNKFDKLHKGTFTELDALWVNQHIVNDKNGFWIKDPLLLNSGISLSWRYSNSDPQHGFFRYLILTYNKLYKQWAEETKSPATYPILDINRSHFTKLDTVDFNNIRGKSAEQLRVVINSLSNGDKDSALEQLNVIASEYGQKLMQSYSIVAPYQEGYAAGDASLITSLNFLKTLEKASTNNGLLGVLPKLTWVEQHGVLKRKPIAINLVEGSNFIGSTSDLEEYYEDGELFNILTTKYKFTPEEANSLSVTGKLHIQLKTYIDRSPVHLNDRSLMYLLTNIMDFKTSQFITNTAIEFGVDEQSLISNTTQLEKISKLINTLVSEIQIPGYPKKAIEKSNLKFILDKIWSNSDYEDLATAIDIEKIDLSDMESQSRVKTLLESRLMLSFLKSKEANESWKKYIAFLMYVNSGSEQNQMLEVRYLNNQEVLVASHNHVLKDILSRYINGEFGLRVNKSSISIIDKYTQEFKLRGSISSYKNLKNRNSFHTTLNYNTLKSYNRI